MYKNKKKPLISQWLFVGVAGLQPYHIINYISISYEFKNLTVDRFVDGILNELRVR